MKQSNIVFGSLSPDNGSETAREWSINEAMQHGISLEESKRRVENVIYDHFHSRVCA